MSEVTPYLELREKVADVRLGSGGREVCAALTDVMDRVMARLADRVPGVAVVAVGGYGRGELCLGSDIDVMLLHGGRLPERAVRQVLYPLWDAKLAVGHSVRSLKEAVSAAGDDPATLMALLDARCVAGEAELVATFLRKLGDRLRKGKLDVEPALLAAEKERRAAEPYPVQDVDVKLGRGGLRARHAHHWRAQAARLAGHEPQPAPPGLDAATDVLLATRNGLHAISGRAEDRFVFDLRAPVAAWLGLGVDEACRRLYHAARSVDLAGSRPGEPDADLLDLVRAGADGWDRFERLRASGWVDRELPEWSHVVAAPQHVPFHAHPVDAHLWRTAAEVVAVTQPGSGETWAPEVAADLGDPDDVLLAALLHDVGKGLGGDHSERGAALARTAAARLGLPPHRAARIARSVELHLLLPDVATRRDLDDPVVIAQAADLVGDLGLLRMLYLVAVADARATGPGMWTEWKASLVRTLFARTAAELTRRQEETGPTTARSRRLAELEAAALPRFERALVRAHIRDLPAEYADTFDVAAILRHLELVSALPAEGHVRIAGEGDGPISAVTVVGRNQPGLLAAVAGVLALHNVSILDARLFTRSDGVVLDTFRVEDSLGRSIPSERWEAVAAGVSEALAGALDLDREVAAKGRAYRRARAAVPARVEHHPDASPGDTVLEVHCGDEIGRLYRIAHALTDLGLDVRLAKIDTRGEEVVDVFYVRRVDGAPVTERAELATVMSRLAEELGPRPEDRPS